MEEILHQLICSLSRIPLFAGFYASHVVQDFFHQQQWAIPDPLSGSLRKPFCVVSTWQAIENALPLLFSSVHPTSAVKKNIIILEIHWVATSGGWQKIPCPPSQPQKSERLPSIHRLQDPRDFQLWNVPPAARGAKLWCPETTTNQPPNHRSPASVDLKLQRCNMEGGDPPNKCPVIFHPKAFPHFLRKFGGEKRQRLEHVATRRWSKKKFESHHLKSGHIVCCEWCESLGNSTSRMSPNWHDPNPKKLYFNNSYLFLQVLRRTPWKINMET